MFIKIPGPSTLGSYNVQNVLACSHILIWVCFVGQAVFLDQETQKNTVFWVGKVILLCQEHYPNIELDTMPMCFKMCYLFNFLQVGNMFS